jgi:hypothetical protein
MLPPFSGGLHCGYCCAPATGVMVTCTPRRLRRAPLRLAPPGIPCSFDLEVPPSQCGLDCGNGYPAYEVCTMCSLPVVPRRAPLRRVLDDCDGDPSVLVLPPIEYGLHCGQQPPTTGTPTTIMFLPVSGGLHCGNANAYDGFITILCSRGRPSGSIAALETQAETQHSHQFFRPSRRLHCGTHKLGPLPT